MEQKDETAILCREYVDPAENDQRQLEKRQKADEPGAKKAIRCRSCGQVVTDLSQKISVDGSHAHTFFNPAGIIFELGCFRQAPGCRMHGERTIEFTWFAGYSWCFALCAGCRTHLGWRYEGRTASFFGLILSKLRQ